MYQGIFFYKLGIGRKELKNLKSSNSIININIQQTDNSVPKTPNSIEMSANELMIDFDLDIDEKNVSQLKPPELQLNLTDVSTSLLEHDSMAGPPSLQQRITDQIIMIDENEIIPNNTPKLKEITTSFMNQFLNVKSKSPTNIETTRHRASTKTMDVVDYIKNRTFGEVDAKD
eukprot:147388_1